MFYYRAVKIWNSLENELREIQSLRLFKRKLKTYSLDSLLLIFYCGAESVVRRPEEIFKSRVSEMPFAGLWGRFDRILIVRKQRFSMTKLTIW
jgi:hypothetical protein